MYISLFIIRRMKENHSLYMKELKEDEKKIHNKWMVLLDILKILIYIIKLFTIITLLRQIKNIFK